METKVWRLVDTTFLCTYSKYYQGGVISVPVGLLILVFWVSLMSQLGFTSEMLDKFFETNDYTTLLSQSDKVEGESDKVSDTVTQQVEVEE